MDSPTSEISNNNYSVIIPAFNAEKTIKRAISSVEKNLLNYEIIVAENGSVDNTSKLVESLCSNNEKIRLIHTKKGVSAARNAGIKVAKGEWVIFVDADDVWTASEESINSLTKAYSEADIISCSYFKDDSLIEHDYRYVGELIDEEKIPDVTAWMLRNPTKTMAVWAKLYKKEFLHNQKLFFNEALRVSEDSEFLLRCMLKCNAVVVSKLPAYRYCSDTPSVIRSIDATRTEGYIKALEESKCDLKGAENVLQDAFVDFTAAHLNLIGVHNIFNCDMKIPWKERVSRIRAVAEQDVIRAEIDNLKGKKILRINNMPSYLFKKRLYTLGGAMCFFKSASNSAHRKNNKKQKELY